MINLLMFLFCSIIMALMAGVGDSFVKNPADGVDKAVEAYVQNAIDSICKTVNVVGLHAIIVKDTSIIGNYTYGNALYCANGIGICDTVELGRRIELWKVASVSKNVIAMAVMCLYDDGFLDLEGDINNYLSYDVHNPSFPDVPITVEMLLSHYSSISQGYYNLKSYKGVQFTSDCPGSRYAYSNINYLLLAQIIEHVTGQRFDEYVKDRIFDNIGVFASFNPYEIDMSSIIYGMWLEPRTNKLSICDVLQSYNKNDIDNYILEESTKGLDPSGGLIITISGMAKYMMLCMDVYAPENKGVVSDSSMARMRVPRSGLKKYGLGTLDYSYIIKGENMYGHTGYAYGIYTSMIYNPEKRYGFVIFCNGAEINYSTALATLHAPIIKVLYNAYLK